MTRGSRGRLVRIDPEQRSGGRNDHVVRRPGTAPDPDTQGGNIEATHQGTGRSKSARHHVGDRRQQAQTLPPDPPKFEAQQSPNFVGIGDILEYKALPQYSEPAWVTKNFVETGKLPPVAERLPKEPMVYKTANMPDGIGVYGDTMRHVIGGRPQGWNFLAGNNQGWGGIDIGMYECLTRTGPLFEVKADELQPMPNLAKSWEWSEDGHQLTMHLVEGAKWSDGVPFTSDDVMFTGTTTSSIPTSRRPSGRPPRPSAKAPSSRRSTTTRSAGPSRSLRDAVPLSDGLRELLPEPGAHPQDHHPKYNPEATYETYKNFPPPDYMNYPVLGAWVVTGYRPDDIVILRRNPYYWKVDEAGNQLPYLDEVVLQALDLGGPRRAGRGRHRRLLQPRAAGELRRVAEAGGRARFAGASRLRRPHHRLHPVPEPLGQRLGRSRRARTGGARAQPQPRLPPRRSPRAIDRQQLGQCAGQGAVHRPPIPGGLFAETSFYDKDSTVYYPVRPRAAKADLAAGGPEGHRRQRLRQLPGRRGRRRERRDHDARSTATTRPTRPSPKSIVAMMETHRHAGHPQHRRRDDAGLARSCPASSTGT